MLFLDELSLYRPHVLDSLRTPLEDGVVRIARAGGVISYPCRFALVGAMNPCACGYLGDDRRACRCSQRLLETYRARLSGPLLDRFDVQVTVARPRRGELLGGPSGEPSAEVGARVQAARSLQYRRYGVAGTTNATAPPAQVDGTLGLSDAAGAALEAAVESLSLSGRGLHRVLRVARTLADLDGAGRVGDDHVVEAVGLRAQDRLAGAGV